MPRHLAALLILLVALTSIGLGAARGTVRMGDEVVLCTGHGIVVTRLPGEPGAAAHLCPDMALSLLAALDAPAPELPPRTERGDAAPLGEGRDRAHPVVPAGQPRAPPVLLGPAIT